MYDQGCWEAPRLARLDSRLELYRRNTFQYAWAAGYFGFARALGGNGLGSREFIKEFAERLALAFELVSEIHRIGMGDLLVDFGKAPGHLFFEVLRFLRGKF